jgi:general stress protein 26
MAKKGDGGPERPRDPARKVRKLMKNAREVMLTTVGSDGRFRSRPMSTGAFEDGALWFLTSVQSAKTGEIADNQRVGVAYASPKNDRYVSISGVASTVRDPERVRELWTREHKAWFRGGKKDPELAVLRVQVDQVEYWDAESGRMVALADAAALGGGETPPEKGGDRPVTSGALG